MKHVVLFQCKVVWEESTIVNIVFFLRHSRSQSVFALISGLDQVNPFLQNAQGASMTWKWRTKGTLWRFKDLSGQMMPRNGLSCGMWDLVPWPWIETGPPSLGAWSLSHWTTREVLVPSISEKQSTSCGWSRMCERGAEYAGMMGSQTTWGLVDHG